MKKLVLVILIAIPFILKAQVKDTVYVADSIPFISMDAFKNTLKYLEDKVTKKQYDEAVQYYQLVIQLNDEKRKLKKKH